MSIVSGVSDFFGLDIGTSSIRLVQLGRGHAVPRPLLNYAQVPIDPKLVLSDAQADQQKVMRAVKELMTSTGITTDNVAVGIPSPKVFSTIVDMERLPPSELAKTIHYQADSLIPTPPDESKIDWVILGDSAKDRTKIEVLITSVANEYAEARLDLLESIGLNVIAFEPDSIALLRALVPPDVSAPVLILDIGSKTTDLVIAMDAAPRLIRSIPTGTEAIIRSAAQNLNISEDQANQFVFKFGLSPDKLEGQVRTSVLATVDLLSSEIEKSIKFFQARYAEKKVAQAIVTGSASTLPDFPLYIANKFNINVEIGNAWRNVAFPAERQNELMAISHYFGVAAGLAQRNE